MTDSGYVMGQAEGREERARLRHLEAWMDPATTQCLTEVGVRDGMRCLEAGAGGGSITRWLSARVGATGSVVATDIDTRFLTDLPANVEVRRHDMMADDLEAGAFDVVHCRALLQHVRDPRAGLHRLAAAVAPGGWLVVEEGDFGLLTMAGPESARATTIARDVIIRLTSAGILDAFLGRKLPGLVHELGWHDIRFDAVTSVAVKGDSAYEVLRLGWPQIRLGAAAAGVSEDDLACVDAAYETDSAPMVTLTCFAVRARKPNPAAK